MNATASPSTQVFLKGNHDSHTFPRSPPGGGKSLELEEYKSMKGPPVRKKGVCAPFPPRSLSFNTPRTSPRMVVNGGGGGTPPKSPLKGRHQSGLLIPITSSPNNLAIPSPTDRRKTSASSESKIAVLGKTSVGKSAVVVRLLTGRFIWEYDPTLEATYRYHSRLDDENIVIEVMDTAGVQEDDDEDIVNEAHIRWAEGFVLIFSLTDRSSFEAIKSIHDFISSIKSTPNFPCVILANKDDLVHSVEVLPSECFELGANFGVSVFPVSACEGSHGLRTAFHELHRDISRRRAARRRRSSAKFVMEGFVKIFSR